MFNSIHHQLLNSSELFLAVNQQINITSEQSLIAHHYVLIVHHNFGSVRQIPNFSFLKILQKAN